MYKDALQNIDNVAVWPIVSFIIFFVFFSMVIWWAFKADKSFLAEMSNKPLEEDDSSESTQHKTPRL